MGLFQWLSRGSQDLLSDPQLQGASRGTRRAMERGDDRPSVLPFPLPRRAAAVDLGTGGLDFASSIQTHRDLKNQLLKYLHGESKNELDYRCVCQDNQCPLGQWIHGTGVGEFGHLPSFTELRTSHRQFHREAGRIMQLHDKSHTNEAMQELRNGEFAQHSIRVMGLLSSLYVEVSDTVHGSA